MVFEHPKILYGLFLIAVPLLIHLLNFRKTRTIYFSSVKFLEEIESSHRNRRNLQDLLLMLMRMILIGLVVIAFAQPSIVRDPASVSNNGITGIYLDNSESMGIASGDETLLARAKSSAIDLIRSFRPDMRYYLLCNGNNSEFNGFADAEIAIERINNLQISDEGGSLTNILSQFVQLYDSTKTVISEVFLFSDFSLSNLNSPLPLQTVPLKIIPVSLNAGEVPNLSIDTCWFESPEHRISETDVLSLMLGNYSDQEFSEVTVSLQVNDTLRSQQVVSVPSNGKKRVDLPFTIRSKGWQKGRVSISDYPYEADNEMFFTYPIESGLPVLQLYGAESNRFIKAIFATDSTYRYEEYAVRGYPRSDFNGYNLIILNGIREMYPDLNERISKFLKTGGTVLFFPEMDGQLVNYNGFLSEMGLPSIVSINHYQIQSKIGSGLVKWIESIVINPGKNPRMPAVNQSFRFSTPNQDFSDLLSGMGGELLLSQFPTGNGRFVLASFPLNEESTDLMFHPLFLPLGYKLASSGNKETSIYQTIGNQSMIEMPVNVTSGSESVRLIFSGTGDQFSPEIRPGPGGSSVIFVEGLQKTGFYTLMQGEQMKAVIAYNMTRHESDLRIAADSLVLNHLRKAGWDALSYKKTERSLHNNSNIGTPDNQQIWHYLLIFSIIILILESWLMHNKK
jgi:hypothetical protein